MLRHVPVLLVAVALAACQSLRAPAPPAPKPPPTPEERRPQPEQPAEPEAPEPPAPPPQKQFRLSPASLALAEQARTQAEGGNFAAATATLERALRIEPDNPLLWIELGRVRLDEGNAAQADSMGRKALALATGDPRAQGAAWQLIADSLRVRGRNQEASEAERRAAAAVPR